MNYPTCFIDLTKEWLSSILQQEINSFLSERIGEKTGLLSEVYRIFWDTNEIGNISSVVIKFPNAIGLGASTSMYDREILLYKYIKENNLNDFGISMPKCYFVDSDENFKQFVLVLEDCSKSHSIIDLSEGLSYEKTKIALKEIAKFHAKWWNNEKTLPFSYGKSLVMMWAPFVELLWSKGKQCLESENLLFDDVIKITEFIIKYSKCFQSKNITLVHGDFKSDNFLISNENDSSCSVPDIIVIDFQQVHNGNPMEDISYLFSCSIDSEIRRKYEIDLLQFYHECLVSFGISNYSLDKCIYDYREHLIYAILMPIITSGMKSNTNDENLTEIQKHANKVLKIWRNRSITSVMDNKCIDLLENLSKYLDQFNKPPKYPKLDSDVAAIVDYYQQTPIVWDNITIEDRRKALQMIVGSINLDNKEDGIKSITNYPKSSNYSSLRIYAPEKSSDKIVYIIPGYWVGGIEIGEKTWQKFCTISNSNIVVIRTSLSPECKSNEIVIECENTLKFFIKNNHEFGLPKVSSVSLIGEKQGAHTAICLINKLISSEEDYLIDSLSLVCPWIDHTCSGESYEEVGELYGNICGKKSCLWHWDQYISTPPTDDQIPLDFNNETICKFPKTLVITAICDPNVSDALQFIDKLKSANVNFEYVSFEGVIQLFYASMFTKGTQAMEIISKFQQ